MIRKNRFILILFFLYFIVNVQAQSYYADKTFGIGVSSGILEHYEKVYPVTAVGISLAQTFDFAAGFSKIGKYNVNIISWSISFKPRKRQTFMFPQLNFSYSHWEYSKYNYYDFINFGLALFLRPFTSRKFDLYIVPMISRDSNFQYERDIISALAICYGVHLNKRFTVNIEPNVVFDEKPAYAVSLGIYFE